MSAHLPSTTHELGRVLAACRQAIAVGVPAMLATVVRVEGSAYRRPGARMVLSAGAEPVGMISGGCLESDLLERAGALLAAKRPEVVVYDMRSPDDVVWGLGLGCDGEVRVLLESVAAAAPPAYLAFLERCELARAPGVLVTVFDAPGEAGIELGDRLCVDASGTIGPHARREALARVFGDAAREALRHRRSAVHAGLSGSRRVEALVEYVSPRPSLAIFGAGGDALPVVRLALEIGWRVVVFDHRAAWARPERFPGAEVHTIDYARLSALPCSFDESTAAIVMTHHFLNDLELMAWLPETPAFYIGLLGPQRRTAKLLEEARRRGVSLTERDRSRIFAPIGLDLASESPAEIALSAVAEIRAVLGGRRGGFLRDRRGPLHEKPVVERSGQP